MAAFGEPPVANLAVRLTEDHPAPKEKFCRDMIGTPSWARFGAESLVGVGLTLAGGTFGFTA